MRLPAARQRLRSKKQHHRAKKKRLPAGRQLVYQKNEGLRSTEESRMTVSMKRILAAVYPPENAAALVILSLAIVDKMDGNPYFPNPVPSLAKVKGAMWDPLESTCRHASLSIL